MYSNNIVDIPCRHGHKPEAPATAIYYAPEGCLVFEDKIIALCKQHEVTTLDSGYPLIKIVNLIEEEDW